MRSLRFLSVSNYFPKVFRSVVHSFGMVPFFVNVGSVEHAFIDPVPNSGLKGAVFPLLCRRVPIAKCIHTILILHAVGAQAQDLSAKELAGIRRVCKLEPQLQPLVQLPNVVVDCKDFELWWTLKKLGREREARALTREIYAEQSQ